MMTRAAIILCWVMAIALALFLIAPLAVIAAASFSPTPVFDLPLTGASTRWYGRIGRLDGFWPSLLLSLVVAGLSWFLVEKPALGLKRRLLGAR